MRLPGSGSGTLVLIACVFLAWLTPESARAGSVAGTVSDARTGGPVAAASVRLTGTTGAQSTASGADGSFEIPDLDDGRYDVRVLLLGYDPFEREIQVAGNRPFRLEVLLVRATQAVDSVEVRGTRVETREIRPGVLTLGREQIRSLPAFGEADPIRTLQLLPGVQAASDFSTGLYVRGGGPDQTLILLDDVPVYNPTHAFGLFSTFNSDVLDDVTLHKGAYPARYGGRLSAVLEVNTDEGDSEKVTGTAGLSVVAARLGLNGPLGKRGGRWMLSASRTYLDPVLSALRTEDNDLPSYYFYDSNGKLVLPLSLNSRLTLDGYLSQDDLRVDLDEGFFFDVRWSNRTASATWEYDLSPTLTSNIKAFVSRYSSQTSAEFFNTPAAFGNQLRDTSALASLDWRPGATHSVKTGLQFSDYDFSFLSSFNQDVSIEYAARPKDYSFFVEDDWTPGDRINIQEGVRIRYFTEGRRWLFEPRLSVSLPASDTVTLQAGSGLYNQYIQLISTEGFSGGDFYLPLDETVKPGFAWQNVLGARWDPTSRWRFSLEGYASDLRNLVLLETDSSADESGTASETVFRSGGTGYSAGVEAFAEKRTGTLRGWVGYTLGWTRRTFREVNGGREFPPKYDRRNDLNVVALVSRGKWKYSGSFVFATGQAFTTATARYGIRDPATGMFEELVLPGERNGARLEPYHRLDVSATRAFSFFGYDAEWVFQVFNLYGRRNEWFVQYDIDDGEFDAEVVQQLPMIPTAGLNVTF